MKPRFHPMTEQDAQAVTEWRYPPPYDIYRWPDWEEMLRDDREFTDPAVREAQYLSVRDEDDADAPLLGYVQLFALDRAIRIGIGLRPDACGRGLGTSIVKLAVEEAARRMPGAEIDLEVEHWNKRAIRAYERAGFAIADVYTRRATHGVVNLYCMVWNGDGISEATRT